MKVDSDNWIGAITFNCSYFDPIGSWIYEHWVPGLRNHWPCLKEFSSFFIDFPNKFCRIKPGSHIRWLEPGTHTRNNRNILLTSTDSTWFTITILRDTPLDFFRFWAMLLSSNFGKWSIFLTMVKLSSLPPTTINIFDGCGDLWFMDGVDYLSLVQQANGSWRAPEQVRFKHWWPQSFIHRACRYRPWMEPSAGWMKLGRGKGTI